jgi:DNA-binding GntR family transcriptional regulator
LSLRHHGQEALQLVDVRQALESGLIARAMDLMTAEHLAAVEDSLLRMEALAAAGENFAEPDAEFHRRLFEPLGNELLVSLLGVFRKVHRRLRLELGTLEHGTVGPGSVALGAAEDAGLLGTPAVHRGIYEAVASGDKVLAAQRLGSHFDGMRRRIAGLVGE